jgi:hypothetical protein
MGFEFATQALTLADSVVLTYRGLKNCPLEGGFWTLVGLSKEKPTAVSSRQRKLAMLC